LTMHNAASPSDIAEMLAATWSASSSMAAIAVGSA
jgi:hypothetical protein